MILDTRRLFLKLLRTFQIDTVCDVGSLDGTDALRFRRVLPEAEVIAFEPNPRNFELMAANTELRRHSIRVLPWAASDRDAEAPFYVVETEGAAASNPAFRGMSSLYRRADGSTLAEVARVRTIRLDSLLPVEEPAKPRIALWIDAEGMAFETISGASGVFSRTQMLHVEVETVPCIGVEQRLLTDVERILIDAGFTLLATDQPRTSTQLNALFVRADLLRTTAAQVRWHVANVRLRRRMARARLALRPTRLRRFLFRDPDAIRS